MFSFLLRFRYLFLHISGSKTFPPPLDAKEEKLCFQKARAGDTIARSTLIEHNLRLVAHIVKKYYTGSQCQEDLMSVGTIGLIKAIDSYDPENGAKFATYASKCLQNEILMYFRTQKKAAQEVSMNETIDMDKDGNPLTYMDVIRCEDTIADDLDRKMNSAAAMRVMAARLNDREKRIVVLRYGLGNRRPATQREIATKLGISRSYVSRLEKSALEKIHEGLQDRGRQS